MKPVSLVKRLSPKIVVLLYGGDQAIWTTSKQRKPATCAVSGRPLAIGELTYRPVGNQQYRSSRIAAEVVDKL